MKTFIKPTQLSALCYLLVVVWLCSLIVHSQHAIGVTVDSGNAISSEIAKNDILSQVENEQECHLCYNSIDRFDDVTLVAYYSLGSDLAVIDKLRVSSANQPPYCLPRLRAPPVITHVIYS